MQLPSFRQNNLVLQEIENVERCFLFFLSQEMIFMYLSEILLYFASQLLKEAFGVDRGTHGISAALYQQGVLKVFIWCAL